MATYEVNCGNIGTVHQGTNERTARREFREYVAFSKSGRGRAGGENVVLFKDGEILTEHTGSLDDWEDRDGDL